mmetsp:Transcript_8822/g.19044  ORF Transcript_8822/g.19044 Transcript_8822/m.19044 type:complete len:206 (+) Transcript_8822:457-1074(+)
MTTTPSLVTVLSPARAVPREASRAVDPSAARAAEAAVPPPSKMMAMMSPHGSPQPFGPHQPRTMTTNLPGLLPPRKTTTPGLAGLTTSGMPLQLLTMTTTTKSPPPQATLASQGRVVEGVRASVASPAEAALARVLRTMTMTSLLDGLMMAGLVAPTTSGTALLRRKMTTMMSHPQPLFLGSLGSLVAEGPASVASLVEVAPPPV